MPFGDYAVPPGAWLQEWIEDQGTTRDQAAEDLGWSRKRLDEVVDGTAPVTGDMPAALAELTGIPADSWQRYEAQYRADLNQAGSRTRTDEAGTLPQQGTGCRTTDR